jgi:hypothetical protein
LTLHDFLGEFDNIVNRRLLLCLKDGRWHRPLLFFLVLDSKFINTFLLTYRSFCTTDEWFDLLVQRYDLSAPGGLTPEEVDLWGEKKLKLVRLR